MHFAVSLLLLTEIAADNLSKNRNDLLLLFHRCTRASYVYNGCLAWYNVVLTPQVHSSVKLGIPLAIRAMVE